MPQLEGFVFLDRVFRRLFALWQTAVPQQCKTILLCTTRPRLGSREICPVCVKVA